MPAPHLAITIIINEMSMHTLLNIIISMHKYLAMSRTQIQLNNTQDLINTNTKKVNKVSVPYKQAVLEVI